MKNIPSTFKLHLYRQSEKHQHVKHIKNYIVLLIITLIHSLYENMYSYVYTYNMDYFSHLNMYGSYSIKQIVQTLI